MFTEDPASSGKVFSFGYNGCLETYQLINGKSFDKVDWVGEDKDYSLLNV